MSLEELKVMDASNIPLGNLISVITRGYSIYVNHHLERLGINSTQLHLLFEISNNKEINQEKIASRININKGSVARSIKKLEEKGLITREIDEKNRRQNKISLTDEGNNVLDESTSIIKGWDKEVLNNNYLINEITLKESLKEICINTIEVNKRGENERN